MGCATSKPPPASSTGNSSNPQVLKPSMDAVLRAASSEPGERQKTKQRERIVYAKGFSEGLHFEKIPKKVEELKSICTIFDACYVFSNLSQEQKEDLGAYMKRVDLVEGDKVENCHSLFYGIDYGSFEFKNEEEKSSGESRSHTSKEPFFGEMSLMFNSERSGQTHAICISDFGRLWAIDRDTFRQVIASSDLQSRDEKRNAVTSIKLLKDALSDEQLNRLIEAVHMLRFPIGHQIVRKGDVGEVCYFIKQGTVLCSKIGENQLGQVELSTGSYFGERALLRDEPRAADVHAVTDVIAMALNRKEFDELLGPLRSVMDSNMKERVVEGLPILKELSPRLRQEVIADFELESFEQGEYIVTLGDVNVDKFYVVRAGVVTVLDGDKRTIATLKEGNWFGEMALLNDQPRGASCVATSPIVECFVLRRATFQTLVNESKILNSTSEHRKNVNLARRGSGHGPEGIIVKEEKAVLQLANLEKHRILGKGTFGTVYLVSSSGDKQTPKSFYALKCMNKYNLVRCEQKANVMNEKKILSECDSHPFVLELFQTFQDRDFLYMLLEFVQGGELFSIMQEKYRFPLYPTMFYSACIVDVFEHVHSLNVVYRDLKPENVLVDRLGYVKLADFGFAKRVFDKTYTLCGTPEYLAPEVVLGSGHDKGVDYWGIGILIYEMLLGMSPFADEYDEDQHVVCNNIVRGRVGFEKLHRAIAESESKIDPFWTYAKRKNGSTNTNKQKPLYPEVEDLIKRLLNKNPIQRLGNLKDGARDVKRHSFFAELNWEDLRARRFPPPYVPNVKSSDDTSRFDVFEPDAAWPAYKGAQDWCIGF